MRSKPLEKVIFNGSKRGSEIIRKVASDTSGGTFNVKIDDLIAARGISQRQLSDITGIQLSYLSDFLLGKTTTINKTHLLALMAVLRVTDITEIFDVTLPIEKEEKYKWEQEQWIDTKIMPDSVKELAHIATDIRND